MREQFGKVLGWISNTIAVLIIVVTVTVTLVIGWPQIVYPLPSWAFLIMGAIPAVVIFLIGRALRNFFAGPHRST
jgi:hypothetical protein